ncbi:MAG TPA: diacylglycerol kinase family protein [Chitinophagaceae bacterium]|jgi:diacylglycerol kinase family enzyme
MKLLFIVNPISGGVDKESFLNDAKQLCNQYGISFTVFKTTGINDKTQLQKILDLEQPDKVAAVGGDGTVLFAATCLLDSKFSLGIIPKGSANGMAKELNVDVDAIEALKDIIMSEVYLFLDLLRINGTYYSMHIGDVGINANLVSSFSKDSRRGMITYGKYFIEEIKKTKPFPVRVEMDGDTTRELCYMAAICNSGRYGTGVILSKQSNLYDGKFEIVLLMEKGIDTLIDAGLTKFNESFYKETHTHILSGTHARLYFDEERLLQLDGEIIGSFAELEIELLKGAVRIVSSNKK